MVTFLDAAGRKVADHASYFREQLSFTVDTIKNAGKEVILVQQVPIFHGARDCDWQPRINRVLNKKRVCSYDSQFIAKWQQPSIDFVNEFAAAHHLAVLDPAPFFDGPLHDGINLYRDSDHLNDYGRQFIVPYFIPALDKLLAGTGIEHQGTVRQRGLTRVGNGKER